MKEVLLGLALFAVFCWCSKIAINSSKLVEKYFVAGLILGPPVIIVVLILLGYKL